MVNTIESPVILSLCTGLLRGLERGIEHGMGITIDGYNFREDLLRGAGNGVVWQTDALAFEDLMSKF